MTLNYIFSCVTVLAFDWVCFRLGWLKIAESDKVCRSHLADSLVDYDKFRDGLITLFGSHKCENNYRVQLRSLRQAGSKSVADYAARVTDICLRAYPSYTTEVQRDLAVENFISGLVNVSSREYLQRKRARCRVGWNEAVQITQASVRF